MTNLNLIFPEIFISLAIMFLLIVGVFKKNSSNLIYNLTIISLLIALALILIIQLKLNLAYLMKVIKLITYQLL